MLRKSWMAAAVACCAVALLSAFTTAGSPAGSQAATTAAQTTAASSLPPGTVLGSYPGGNTVDTEIRYSQPGADGYYHINVKATIAQLKKLHVNTYLYLIWHSPTDWSDLNNGFLAAARQAGIKVWVYLVPPSECDPAAWCSDPYQENYVKWAQAIAKLSTEYKNLTGWAIDDFTNAQNSALFTPSYMQQIKQATDAINPNLGLYTTAYYPTAISDAFYQEYAPYIKGIIFPYRDSPDANTQNAVDLAPELDAVTADAGKYGVNVMLEIYTGRYSTFDEPTVSYVQATTGTGLRYASEGKIQGIISYGTPHLGAPAVSSDNQAMYGNGSLVFEDYGATTPAGAYESATETVKVNPNAPLYAVQFWRYNRYYSPPTTGRLMQVLVDGKVVWSSDIATDSSGGQHEYTWADVDGPIVIDPSILHGKTTATLTFRLQESQAASYRSTTAFDTVQTSGFQVENGGFETQADWTMQSTVDNMIPAIDIYDPNLPTHVFDSVAAAFSH
jgi:hypothetical protein